VLVSTVGNHYGHPEAPYRVPSGYAINPFLKQCDTLVLGSGSQIKVNSLAQVKESGSYTFNPEKEKNADSKIPEQPLGFIQAKEGADSRIDTAKAITESKAQTSDNARTGYLTFENYAYVDGENKARDRGVALFMDPSGEKHLALTGHIHFVLEALQRSVEGDCKETASSIAKRDPQTDRERMITSDKDPHKDLSETKQDRQAFIAAPFSEPVWQSPEKFAEHFKADPRAAAEVGYMSADEMAKKILSA
jgi:hypothetical protein